MKTESVYNFYYPPLFGFVILFFIASATAQTEFKETFSNHPLSHDKWNFCQTAEHLNRPVQGADRSPRSAYRFGIDKLHREDRCTCNKRGGCEALEGRDADLFGPDVESDEETPLLSASSLSDSQILQYRSVGGNQCDGYDVSRVPFKKNRVVQKNEIRLWGDDWPAASDGYWYSFRFKIDGEIDRCGSMRWVGGQFKAVDKGDSPFLAQRFDNGVFHVTIEAPHDQTGELQRIIVAKAQGNPDFGSRFQKTHNKNTKLKDSVTCDMSGGSAKSSGCGFSGKVENHGINLPGIGDGWIDMAYYIEVGGACEEDRPAECPRALEIWAQGEKVATVSGHFGGRDAHKKISNLRSAYIVIDSPGTPGW